ncbi:RNA polymerase sigma factor [Telmatobacter bradus]|uniref:RNA polymerase sigma factor n=1 Tax=Telmatobacter bradus TaxID=474953 RepID=UPI003B434188
MTDAENTVPPESGSLADLVAAHGRVLYRIAYSVLRRPDAAEDAVQQAFLELCRNQRWQQLDDARAYLAQIVWRTAIREHKRHQRNTELPVEIRSPRPGPEKQLIDQQRNDWLHKQIDALPETLRLPLALLATGDLKLVEIARLLDLPEGTVRRRVHEARLRLREQLETREGEHRGQMV